LSATREIATTRSAAAAKGRHRSDAVEHALVRDHGTPAIAPRSRTATPTRRRWTRSTVSAGFAATRGERKDLPEYPAGAPPEAGHDRHENGGHGHRRAEGRVVLALEDHIAQRAEFVQEQVRIEEVETGLDAPPGGEPAALLGHLARELQQAHDASAHLPVGVLDVQDAHGSFDRFIWGFVDGAPRQNRWKRLKQIPATTTQSDRMSRELKVLGFRFVGSTICYAYMQAAGLVNDHTVTCFRHEETRQLAE
jgi:hypothetical protein